MTKTCFLQSHRDEPNSGICGWFNLREPARSGSPGRSRLPRFWGSEMRTLFVLLLSVPILAWGQQDQASMQAALRSLAWQDGPADGRLADKAKIAIPEGFVFLDSNNTLRFLELAGNPPRDGYYTFAPKTLSWFSVFSFNPSGYVKDDEKINSDELLRTLRDADLPSNEERKRLGMPSLTTEGWEVPPHYDVQTKRLEWGVRLKSGDGSTVVNYTTRILGRTGVMSATLVADQRTLQGDIASFKATLAGFNYLLGERYAEFKQGDRMAEYGLAALIVGGAAAVATKKGFWAVIAGFFAAFWKVIATVAVGGLAWLGSIFKRKAKN